MAYEKTLPDGSPILDQSEFTRRYLAAMKAMDKPFNSYSVLSSWHLYLYKPAKHFITKQGEK